VHPSLECRVVIASAGGAAVATGLVSTALANDAFTNTTPADVNVFYTVVPVSSFSCVGDEYTITVPVKAEPVVANQTATVCSDGVTGVTLGDDANTPAVASYRITGINSNGLTASAGSPAAGANLAANVIADDAWTNTTAAAVNVVYTIVPVGDNGCEGDAFTVTVTVNPEPVVANQTATVCSDGVTGVTLGNDSDGPTVATNRITGIN
jgi:hypothetical protein